VDWYVDVSLCYLDVYNVSGDEIRFVEKRIEDADLDTVARVIGNVKLKVAPQKSLAFIGKSLRVYLSRASRALSCRITADGQGLAISLLRQAD